MHLLFLDIDGVLNSKLDAIRGRFGFVNTKTINCLNPEKVDLLYILCKETDAKIVVTSNWRRHLTDEEIAAEFAKHGITSNYFLGCTPRLHAPEVNKHGIRMIGDLTVRSAEIELWKQQFPETIEKMVILDDNFQFSPIHFLSLIHINSDVGLTYRNFIHVLREFKPEHPLLKDLLPGMPFGAPFTARFPEWDLHDYETLRSSDGI